MAKAVADTDSESNQGGFTDDGSNITGFSSLHDSGTGGSPSLGNFPLFPYSSCVNDTVDGCTYPKTARSVGYMNESLQSSPGYFAITLNSGVAVDMTTTMHTSLFRFTFPSSAIESSPLILMDLTDLSDSRQDNASVSVDGSTGRITGSGRFLPSFGSGNYTVHFCSDFQGSTVRDNGIFVNTRASTDVKELTISRGINSSPLPGGAFNRFQSPGSDPILARVGLSFISPDQACSNAESEIPSFDFDQTQQAAIDAWRSKLSPISVSTEGVSPDFTRNFYSECIRAYICHYH